MSKVIDFLASKQRLEKNKLNDNLSLNKLLEKATVLKGRPLAIDSEKIIIPLTLKQLEISFSSRIADILLAQKSIERENLFCINYIANLFVRMVKNENVKSWCAFDYIKEYERQKDSLTLKKGAEICFFSYSFFCKEDEGLNSLYKEVGSSLYLNFFKISQEIVSYYMGKNFDLLGQITNQSIRSFQKKSPC